MTGGEKGSKGIDDPLTGEKEKGTKGYNNPLTGEREIGSKGFDNLLQKRRRRDFVIISQRRKRQVERDVISF